MSLPLSLDLLVEMIRAYSEVTGTPPKDMGRDKFYAAHRAMGMPYTNEFKQLWPLAKTYAAQVRDLPEPLPIAEPPEPTHRAGFEPAHSGLTGPCSTTELPMSDSRSTPVRGSRIPKMLVIPDAHAHPQYSNERFAWLGALIAEERPDVIACLGDFSDMPSLSGYDKGKRGFEGRRYTRDVDCTREALAMVEEGPASIPGYDPEKVLFLGNHEARIDRATSDCAELEGAITTRDLGFEEYGWRVVPYMESRSIGGFAISHHFASGVNGRPIGGMTMAASMARLLFTSAIVGHSHTLDWARRTRPDGSRVVTLVPGCYTAPEQGEESWCKSTSHLWWRGVAILEDVAGGDFGALRLISQDSMRERYGRTARPAPTPRPKPAMWERP